jgi:hypothetical protein
MQFSPLSCHFIALRSKYIPQHPVLKHPQSVFFSLHEIPGSTPTETTSKIIVVYVFVFTRLDCRRETRDRGLYRCLYSFLPDETVLLQINRAAKLQFMQIFTIFHFV